jgi:cobalt-zinc-cadmium efflux system protein
MAHTHQPRRDSISNIHEYRNVAKNRLIIAMAITGSVMGLEFAGSIFTGSLALGSDAWHMFTHLFALAISFVAILIACKAPCHHRTYGFYRVEILAAMFNSIFLFAVTAYILFEGITRLIHPQPVAGFEMLIVALFGLAANGATILLLHGSIKEDLNIKSAFLHMFADAASSVVIIIGAVVVSLTHWYIVDPLLAIGISVLIFVWAGQLFRDSVNVLLETAPKGLNVDIIAAELEGDFPEIVNITDLHIWEITSNMYSLTAHIQIKPTDYPKTKQLLDGINKVLAEKYGIEHTTIQFNPVDA